MMQREQYAEHLRDIALRALCPMLSFEKRRDLATWPIEFHGAKTAGPGYQIYGETRTNEKRVCIFMGQLVYTQEFAYDVLHELCHVPQGAVCASMFEIMFGNPSHSSIWATYMQTIGLKPIASGDIREIAMNDANWNPELLAKIRALGKVEGLL